MKRMELFPLFCVSSTHNYGTRAVLSTIVELMPNAYEMEELHAFVGAEGDQTVEIHANDDAPFAALVFKTQSEPHVGDVSLFRILSGSVAQRRRGVQRHARRRGEAQPSRRSRRAASGSRCRASTPATSAAWPSCATRTRTTRCRRARIRCGCRRSSSRSRSCRWRSRRSTAPTRRSCRPGLHRLHDEDPSFEIALERRDARDARHGPRRAAPRGRAGEAEAEVRRRGRAASSRASPIARRSARAPKGRDATRSSRAAAGSSATAGCASRPSPRGDGIRFEDQIVGGSIPSKFIPAVEKGIHEAAERGVLAGYPLVDFKVELFDGSYHTVDSNEMSFKMAGILAFKTVAPKCKPVLLEPLDEVDDRHPRRLPRRRARRPLVAARRRSSAPSPRRPTCAARACARWCRSRSCTSTRARCSR